MAQTGIVTRMLSLTINSQFLIEAQIHVKIKKSCSKFVLISNQANYFHGMLKILNQIKKKREKKKIQYQKLLPENYYM